ncbi:hypothetical protein SBADM41S_11849 [Streptomyces badius]
MPRRSPAHRPGPRLARPARCGPCAAQAAPADRPPPPGPGRPPPEPQTSPAPEPQARATPGSLARPEPRATATPPPPRPTTLALVTVLACVTLAAATGAARARRVAGAGPRRRAPRRRRPAGPPAARSAHLPLAAAAVLLLGGAAALPGHAGPGPPDCWAAWPSAALPPALPDQPERHGLRRCQARPRSGRGPRLVRLARAVPGRAPGSVRSGVRARPRPPAPGGAQNRHPVRPVHDRRGADRSAAGGPGR